MQIRAPAKTNLYLAVTGRRPDGYHDIESLFVALPDLYDTMTVKETPTPGLTISCDRDGVPCDDRNLIYQSVLAFCKETGFEPCWHVHLTKRIPVAAGLGGGSSDAAAMLRALPALCGVEFDQRRLLSMGASIGADVPFFLQDSPCVARGIGEQLTPLAIHRAFPILLVNPGFPVPTAWAYMNVDPSPGAGIEPLLEAFRAGDIRALAATTYNAFEDVVFRKFPLLDLIAEVLRESGALCVRLSGSGPTIFALLPTLDVADRCRASLLDRFGDTLWTWSGFTG